MSLATNFIIYSIVDIYKIKEKQCLSSRHILSRLIVTFKELSSDEMYMYMYSFKILIENLLPIFAYSPRLTTFSTSTFSILHVMLLDMLKSISYVMYQPEGRRPDEFCGQMIEKK